MIKVNLFRILTSLLVATVFIGCSDDDKEYVYFKGDTLSGLSTSALSIDHTGGTESFTINSATVPTTTTDADWISVSHNGVENKTHTFLVTIAENKEQQERSGKITISSGKSSETVTVTQAASPASSGSENSADRPLGIKALDIAKDIRVGWNIGNTLEVPGGETLWGNPKVNEAYVGGIKAAGFNAVRIPCAWNSYIIDKNNTLDPSWLDRVDEVVGYVLAQNMYAIVNIHWDGGWLENNIGNTPKEELLEKQKTLWTQIANKLGHYNEKLMFAGLNEPNASSAASTASLLQYEQAFIDAVRATEGNNKTRTLIFQGPTTDIDNTSKYFTTNPTDPSGDGYLMAEVHYYTPSDYTIMEKDGQWSQYVKFFWGKDYHLQGSNRNVTWGEEDQMQSLFKKMKTQFADKGIPVILGEFGAYPEEHIANLNDADKALINDNIELVRQGRAHFYNCVVQYGKENGLIPFVWDTGELISRTNGKVPSDKEYILENVMKAADNSKYPF